MHFDVMWDYLDIHVMWEWEVWMTAWRKLFRKFLKVLRDFEFLGNYRILDIQES